MQNYHVFTITSESGIDGGAQLSTDMAPKKTSSLSLTPVTPAQ